MVSPWSKAALFCLAVGLLWGFYKEFSDARKGESPEDRKQFSPARAVLLGLVGGAAALAGLAVLTLLGLADLSRF